MRPKLRTHLSAEGHLNSWVYRNSLSADHLPTETPGQKRPLVRREKAVIVCSDQFSNLFLSNCSDKTLGSKSNDMKSFASPSFFRVFDMCACSRKWPPFS